MAMVSRILLCVVAIAGFMRGIGQVTTGDSLALVDLYISTNGPDWLVKTNWLSDMPVSTWHGVSLDNGRVYSISLYGNNLTGTLPESIGDLDYMRWIEIANNNIGGELPASIGQLSNLESLSLHDNEFSGSLPASMSGMHSLKDLLASSNLFAGNFPEIVFDLTTLERLEIGGNMFTGPIPTAISSLVHLKTLDLASNQFTDTLPFLGDLQMVTEMHLRFNQLEGDLSQIFRYMPNLYYLTLSGNQFAGVLQDSFFNVQRITYLDAQDNYLTGVGDFSDHAQTGTLERLRVFNNYIPFEYLEPNRVIDQFGYAPQHPLGKADTILLQEGDAIQIEAGSLGDYTQYQWFKDGQLLPGEDSSSLIFEHFSDVDNGVYHAEMQNDTLPLLTLTRSPVVLMSLKTGVADPNTKPLQINPNPVSYAFRLQHVVSAGVLQLYTMDGRLIQTFHIDHPAEEISVDFLARGNYILRYLTDEFAYAGTLLKV
jgi:hypothetical protein